MDEVKVSFCKSGEECEEEKLEWDDEEEDQPPALYLYKEDLAPGQDYELVLSFIHKGLEVEEIRESFTTSLDLSQMDPVAVVVDDEVQVTWTEIQGADHYLTIPGGGARGVECDERV